MDRAAARAVLASAEKDAASAVVPASSLLLTR